MKNIFFFLITCLFSLNSFALDTCPGHHQFIFLIHGVGGSERSFGALAEILRRESPCYFVENFVYETGSKLNIHDFSNELDLKIKKTLLESSKDPEDKISLIMHSQGGLVGSLWLKKAMDQDLPLFHRVDAFITLSTPYWGSSMAKWGRRAFYAQQTSTEDRLSPFGKEELLDMTYGSKALEELNLNYQNIFEAGSAIRGLAIGGLKLGFSPHYGEDDTTVSVYSSRPDHYFVHERVHMSPGITRISKSEFQKTKFFSYATVNATHFTTTQLGVADIPPACLTGLCTHPSLPLILDQIAGKGLSASRKEEKLSKFRVHLFLSNLAEYGLSADDVSLSYQLRDNSVHPVAARKRRSDHGYSFAQFTKGNGPETLILTLSIRGTEKAQIQVPVEGGYSTFLHLKLDGSCPAPLTPGPASFP